MEPADVHRQPRIGAGHSLLEPIGGAPARAVIALRRGRDDRFREDDVALVAALVGSVAATINRLLTA